jgi:hypothetical protein
MTNHPHTNYFFQTHFGSDIPTWWRRRKEVVEELSFLYELRQAIYYSNLDRSVFKKRIRYISRKFVMKYETIHFLLGVMTTDPSEPYGVIRDFLNQGLPKLKRTHR